MVQTQDQEEIRIFLEELNENLSFLDDAIIALEEHPHNNEMIEEIFRVAHTIKGNAGFMNLTNLVELGHTMESVFQEFQRGGIPVTKSVIDTLLECKDAIANIGHALGENQDPASIETQYLVDKVSALLKTSTSSQYIAENNSAEEGGSKVSDEDDLSDDIEYVPDTTLVRIFISPNEPAPSIRAFLVKKKLTDVGDLIHEYPSEEDRDLPEFANSEDREVRFWVRTDLDPEEITETVRVDLLEKIEIIEEDEQRKLAGVAVPQASQNQQTQAHRDEVGVADTVRIPVSRLDGLLNLVGELVIANSGLVQIQDNLEAYQDVDDLERDMRDRTKEIFRISADIQEVVMKSRLVPVGQVFNRFKRFVRDYSGKSGKDIQLVISGEETEIDKKIIDEMIKPLTHLVRNSVDHGIETEEERIANGKEPEGRLKLDAFQEGNYINVVVEDDGKGIDKTKIVEKAITKGIINREEASALTEEDIFNLIFHSGFSTKEAVDEISGRGIGMDVVKHSVQLLNGTLDLDSKLGKGTRLTIKLPLTLAIINALIVEIANEKFSIPMASIVNTHKVPSENIIMVEGNEMVRLRDTLIPLIRLDKIFELNFANLEPDKKYPVIVVEFNETLVGFLVDQFLSRQEMVIKSLAENYRPIEGISGASILGDGNIILIIDVHGVIQLYRSQHNPNMNIEKRSRFKKQENEGEGKSSDQQEAKTTSVSRKEEIPKMKRHQPGKKETEEKKAPEANKEQQEPENIAEEDAETKNPETADAQNPTGPEESEAPMEQNNSGTNEETNDDDIEARIAAIQAQHQGQEPAGTSNTHIAMDHGDQLEENLKTLQTLFDPANVDLLKEWLRQGNFRAIQGIQQLTGNNNIKLDKSKGHRVSGQKLDQLMGILQKTNKEMVDFILPILPLDGAVHFILSQDNAHKMVNMLLAEAGLPPLDEFDIEPLMEVTNILGSSYTNSLTQLTDVPVEPGVPSIIEGNDNIHKAIEEKLSQAAFKILYVENTFLWENEDILAELLILLPELNV